MDPEDHLRSGLDAYADTVDPDLDHLWTSLRARLAEAERPVPTRHRWLVPAAAAALVVAVAGATALVAVTTSGPDQRALSPADGPVAGPVGPAWACADKATYDVDPRLPPIEVDLQATGVEGRTREAVDLGVERYELTVEGDTGELRYGDDRGRLQAVTQLRRDGGTWRITSRTLCSGADGSQAAQVSDAAILSEHVPAGDPPAVPADQTVGSAVLLDARPFYDQVGQLRTQSTWVRPESSCRVGGVRCITVTTKVRGDRTVSEGSGSSSDFDKQPNCGRAVVGGGLLDLFGVVDAPGPWLCSLYVTGEEPISVTVRTPDETVTLRRWRGADWDGAYFAGTIREFPGNRAFNFEFTSTYADGRTEVKRY